MAKQHEDIKFLKIDVDDVDKEMEKKIMNFSSVPTFRYFKDGELVKETSGANLENIKLNIKNLLPNDEKSVEPAATSAAAEKNILKDSIYYVSEYADYEKLVNTGLVVIDFTAGEDFDLLIFQF